MSNKLYVGNLSYETSESDLQALFAHLSAIDVAEGDEVSTGETVARVGATGRVTGPHLHWAVRVGGARVDPLSLLAVLGAEPSDAARPPVLH